MVKIKINILSLILFCLIISAAQAQVTVDVSKITCEQFRGYAITDPNNIALWLSGYYNGQRNNTIRPHSALNYRPPAPQTFAPLAAHLDEIIPMQ